MDGQEPAAEDVRAKESSSVTFDIHEGWPIVAAVLAAALDYALWCDYRHNRHKGTSG